jgi:formylmethanofuran dehydrogenase subunit E
LKTISKLPEDFQRCVEFHRHVCPGLAIGYGAVKAALRSLDLPPSMDEEIVTIVENDSCAVDAIQVLLGCTFGKGNLVFRNWGKQVYTFLQRKANTGVRVSFIGPMPGHDERKILRQKIAAGTATPTDERRLLELRDEAIKHLISGSEELFSITHAGSDLPPATVPVITEPCPVCGEYTVVGRMISKEGQLLCAECALSSTCT